MPSFGLPSAPRFSLISMPSGLLEPDLAQCDQVQHDQQREDEGQRDHVKREKAGQRGITNAVVAADPLDEIGADARDGAEQVDDHLRAPVRHVAEGKHVAHECLGHEREVDQHADDPQQLARRLVTAVQQRACHVQVHDDEEERCADRVHVAGCSQHVGHFAHACIRTEFEGGGLARLEVHGDEDARHDLHDEHQQRQRAEEVPDVEILRRVVAGELVGDELVDRQALVEPGAESARCSSIDGGHQATPFAAAASTPMTSLLSPSKLYGGMRQVHRGRRAFEHAAREVELRTVAGAEEAARPVRHHRGITRREARLRQAARDACRCR